MSQPSEVPYRKKPIYTTGLTLPTLEELQPFMFVKRISTNPPTPVPPPTVRHVLSPYCHGLPKSLLNPRERRMLDSPSDEQKEHLKDREKYKHVLDNLHIRPVARSK